MLKEFGVETKERTGKAVLEATDYMDDGSPIKLTVNIDETKVNDKFFIKQSHSKISIKRWCKDFCQSYEEMTAL